MMYDVKPVKTLKVEQLSVEVYHSDTELGQAAANFTAQALQEIIAEQGQANFLSGTGASQFKYYEALVKSEGVDWSQVTCFHLDEYLEMTMDHPASFRKFMQERFWDIVQPRAYHMLGGDAGDIDAEAARYEQLLRDHPIDLAMIGVGENGHIAFNDPPVADFDDPQLVKVVELEEACRKQQMGEGWFPTLENVPAKALSLTIPAMMGANVLGVVAPDARKANAIHNALYGPVGAACPASILRTHANATLFLDGPSASKLK